MSVELLRRAFTVEEYRRMAQAGILREDDRVELLDGEIVTMTPVGSRHAACVNRLTHALSARVVGRAIVSVQNPVQLGERSEPQPDLALLRSRPDFYAGAHPGPMDVLLVIEVADTSIDLDREIKVPLYAQAAIPEVWLVDLAGGYIETYRGPGDQGYREVQRGSRGQHLSPQAFPDMRLAVEDLLG